MKKKILSFLIALCLILPSAFLLAGCDKNNTAKVMTVELNPKIEFVLNKDNTVATVNALNEDGYAIITANVDFIGLSAEDAVNLLLTTAKEKGFVVSASNEELEISISGDDAKKLYNDIKKSASKHLESIGITNITFEFDNIDKDDIVEEVEECLKEYSTSQLNSMSEEELIALLKQSREETQNFVSEELKELYYTLREKTIKSAKLEALLGTANQTFEEYKGKIDSYKNEFIATYLNPESTYNQELKAFVEAKQSLLADKLANVDLTEAQTTLNNALSTLESTMDQVELYLQTFKSNVNNMADEVTTAITNAIQMFPQIAQTLDAKVNQALVDLKTEFVSGDLSQYNVSYWTQPVAE